jgi:branched-chain amino acid transport system permease protein
MVAFSIVVLGGMGNIEGRIIGAFIISFARNICIFFIDPSISEIIPFVVIFIMLVVRPQGILGKKEIK